MIPDVARGYVLAFPCPCCSWMRAQGIACPVWSAFVSDTDDFYGPRGARCLSCNWHVPAELWDMVYAGFIHLSGHLSLN